MPNSPHFPFASYERLSALNLIRLLMFVAAMVQIAMAGEVLPDVDTSRIPGGQTCGKNSILLTSQGALAISNSLRDTLHYAISLPDVAGQLAAMGRFLNDPQILNSKIDGFTPLHLAVRMKRYDAVRVLLSNHADMYKEDDNGHVPISYAFALYDVEMIAIFLKYHFDENHLTSQGVSLKMFLANDSKAISAQILDRMRTVYDSAKKLVVQWRKEEKFWRGILKKCGYALWFGIASLAIILFWWGMRKKQSKGEVIMHLLSNKNEVKQKIMPKKQWRPQPPLLVNKNDVLKEYKDKINTLLQRFNFKPQLQITIQRESNSLLIKFSENQKEISCRIARGKTIRMQQKQLLAQLAKACKVLVSKEIILISEDKLTENSIVDIEKIMQQFIKSHKPSRLRIRNNSSQEDRNSPSNSEEEIISEPASEEESHTSTRSADMSSPEMKEVDEERNSEEDQGSNITLETKEETPVVVEDTLSASFAEAKSQLTVDVSAPEQNQVDEKLLPLTPKLITNSLSSLQIFSAATSAFFGTLKFIKPVAVKKDESAIINNMYIHEVIRRIIFHLNRIQDLALENDAGMLHEKENLFEYRKNIKHHARYFHVFNVINYFYELLKTKQNAEKNPQHNEEMAVFIRLKEKIMSVSIDVSEAFLVHTLSLELMDFVAEKLPEFFLLNSQQEQYLKKIARGEKPHLDVFEKRLNLLQISSYQVRLLVDNIKSKWFKKINDIKKQVGDEPFLINEIEALYGLLICCAIDFNKAYHSTFFQKDHNVTRSDKLVCFLYSETKKGDEIYAILYDCYLRFYKAIEKSKMDNGNIDAMLVLVNRVAAVCDHTEVQHCYSNNRLVLNRP